MIWFLWTSYKYIDPLGFRQHVSFFARLPGATWRFNRSMRFQRQDRAWGISNEF